jgi:hypothetical protein
VVKTKAMLKTKHLTVKRELPCEAYLVKNKVERLGQMMAWPKPLLNAITACVQFLSSDPAPRFT